MKSRDGKYCVDRTKDSTFRIRFYDDEGNRKSKKVKSKTERDALIRAIKRQDDLKFWFPQAEETGSKVYNGTFNMLADEWLVHGECVREISESCLINYKAHLKNHIRPVLGEIQIQNLDLKDIEQLAIKLKKTRPLTRSYASVRKNRVDDDFFEDDEFLSNSYRREILVVACMVTKYGHDRRYIDVNPFAEYKLPECPDQPYDYWRIEEEDQFLQWLEDGGHFTKRVAKRGSVERGEPEYFERPFKMRPGKAEELFDVVLFAVRSGLRKGEIGAIRPCDVNFANNLVLVGRSWSEKERRMKKTTKGKTFRRIEMNDDMRQILKRRIARLKSDHDLIFDTRSWAIKNFSKYCAKAGVREIHFHSLRHTCLTNLANGYGMDKPLPLPQVQIIAGHKDISTTMRYVHTNGIENTTSLQWSREKRKSQSNSPDIDSTVAQNGFLRVISGGAGR